MPWKSKSISLSSNYLFFFLLVCSNLQQFILRIYTLVLLSIAKHSIFLVCWLHWSAKFNLTIFKLLSWSMWWEKYRSQLSPSCRIFEQVWNGSLYSLVNYTSFSSILLTKTSPITNSPNLNRLSSLGIWNLFCVFLPHSYC